MHFIPVLDCQNCSRPISLLPPIQSGNTPSQTLWPWGAASQNFACPSCSQVYEYSASNCRWERLQLSQMGAYKDLANYLLVVPCGREQSSCQIDMIVVARRGLQASDSNGVATGLYLRGVSCGTGHRHNRPIGDKAAITFREMEIL
jgi:hypothetical protein